MFAELFAFYGMPGPVEVLVVGMMVIVGIVFTVLPFWLIFEKAGFPGPMALLMVLPVVNVVMLFFLAFADWPALQQPGGNTPNPQSPIPDEGDPHVDADAF